MSFGRKSLDSNMENLVSAYGNMPTTRWSGYNESEFVKEKRFWQIN
jgi:hypothetical protein